MTVGADLGKPGAVHYPNTQVATFQRPHQKMVSVHHKSPRQPFLGAKPPALTPWCFSVLR